ncbi:MULTISPECIES: hypothetical protein [Bacillus cereus group]|uniref:hypothetical protein n=1 Tax=Bacillus cereus group TaxID=86661 RepID=UPI000BF75B31|nr:MULTISPECIES: hypothetical protein [Bacillus cereus group]MBG9713148.1 membrane protein [Bacillus cereus]MEC5241328.1 hypothetical protein [Bacillus mycoides]MEC5261993.1 hypothetical protein [Bacillus mycoides]PFV95824.1 hypothetical protein COL21_14325 [Bacillus thuringiensis]
MKAKRLVALTVPVLLLFGCGVGDKESTSKVEETSKSMLKTVISEKQYPYYICEQLVEFQFQKDNIIVSLGNAQKGDKKYKEVFKTADAMDEALDRMENIKVPDKYKDIHKLVLEGVTDARKGTKIILDSKGKDANEVSLAIMTSAPHMSGLDGEQWREVPYQLHKETPDAFSKALDKKTKEHQKK